jgi:hypothetical protein
LLRLTADTRSDERCPAVVARQKNTADGKHAEHGERGQQAIDA